MKKLIICIALMSFVLSGSAKEGMWIPLLLQQLNESDMHTMGLKISAEDIYSANNPSLKDAVVIFGGGCTGEVISDQGLVLTNHHCGYGQIQAHSTVEHDYLTDGFWAMSKEQELPNPGLSVTFIVRIEDVTNQMLNGITSTTSEEERQAILDKNKKAISAESTKDTHYEAVIKPFYNGNQFFMYITEKYKDVRLVGAPPSSIGKFGFDTDNWVWPRHTGDFSMFRIYAGKDNKPAEYSKDNKPYVPKRHLKINMGGVQPNDFTMVYGFPGTTKEYLPSYAVDYVLNKSNPAKIHMRDVSLEIIGKAQASSKKINIQYAAKQSRIANAWKKWIGQSKGLKRFHAVERKQELEAEFTKRASASAATKQKYGNLLNEYKAIYAELEEYAFAYDLLIETYYYGPEVLRFSSRFNQLINETDPAKQKELIEKLKNSVKGHFKNYHLDTDKKLMTALMPLYLNQLSSTLRPENTYKSFLSNPKMTPATTTDKLYAKSVFRSEEAILEVLNKWGKSSGKKLAKDPLLILSNDIIDSYRAKVAPKQSEINYKLEKVNRLYMAGLMELMPNYKNYYPDANFTLRLTYGKVEGYEPQDGVVYDYFTTLDGIVQKKDNSTKEFTVPQRLVDLHANKDYGKYADKDGSLHVCFIASNHTTGGNSGSPALDGNGNLIGLNFDRTWESTMSDIMFDPEICRNIMVDIRYVLFVVDKFAGAGHLVEEMTLFYPQPNVKEVHTTVETTTEEQN